MKLIRSTIAGVACLLMLTHAAMAADEEGAVKSSGNSRGDACEKAKNRAAIAAKASIFGSAIIRTGSCDCQQTSEKSQYNPFTERWECTVSWSASEKRRY